MSQYHSVFPISPKAVYSPSNTCDWKLSFAGKKLKANSIRISGNLKVSIAGNAIIPANSSVFYDNLAGVHSFFQSVSVSTDQGILENLNEYPRWVRMSHECTNTMDNISSNGKDLCELRCGGNYSTTQLLRGQADADWTQSFSMKPDCCLNHMSADLSYKRSGSVHLSVRLALLTQALFGKDATAGHIVEMTDLQVQYETVPEDGRNEKVQLLVKHHLKQQIESNNSSIQARVPAKVFSMSVSFLPTADENNINANQWRCAQLPNLTRTQVLWNDSTNQMISFTLESREEVLQNYIKSFNGTIGKNCLQWKRLESSNGGGVGLFFGEPVDLTNQNIGIQLQSDVSNNTPHFAFLWFKSYEQL